MYLPIVDLTKYNTDSEEAKYIQINHIVEKLTTNKKATEDRIKKTEFEFMMDLNILISQTTINPELSRVKTACAERTRRRYRTATEQFPIKSQSDRTKNEKGAGNQHKR